MFVLKRFFVAIKKMIEPDKVYKIAVLGHGMAGQLHTDTIPRVAGLKVVAIADIKYKGETGRSENGVRIFGSYEDLARSFDDYDAAIVALPIHLHYEAVDVLSAKRKPMLLEKPLAEDIEGANKIARRLRETQTRCMVGLTGRFHPEFLTAYSCRERVGHMVAMSESIHFGNPSFAKKDFIDSYLSGNRGVGLENGYHTFDRFNWFSDSKIVDVKIDSIGNENLGGSAEDHLAGTAITKNGGRFNFSWRWTPVEEEDYVFEFTGERGKIIVRGFRECRISEGESRPDALVFSHNVSKSMRDRHIPGFTRELYSFREFLDTNKLSYLEEALAAQNAVEMLYTR